VRILVAVVVTLLLLVALADAALYAGYLRVPMENYFSHKLERSVSIAGLRGNFIAPTPWVERTAGRRTGNQGSHALACLAAG
jgi:hypothetical protein